MVGRICPPGWDRVKVSENLGATSVAPVAPADTSLYTFFLQNSNTVYSWYNYFLGKKELPLLQFEFKH